MRIRPIIALVISFLFILYEKTPILTVTVDDHFSGSLNLTPCADSAPEPVLIDQLGNGVTSSCPSGRLNLVVIKGSKTIHIPYKNLKIDRAGDGLPIDIIASVP